jgi:cob(I)alamin adenosyltransferase
MPKLTRIYTRTGDDGTTGLIGGRRVHKNALRIEAYGTVDELSSVIGVARAALAQPPTDAPHGALQVATELDRWLAWTQDVLFNLGCELATPDAERRAKLPRIEQRHVDALERDIDAVNDDLPALKSFVLPGGGWASAYFHLARTVCRRCERLVVALAAHADVGELPVAYLNRLADALFVWGRWCALKDGKDEPLWDSRAT